MHRRLPSGVAKISGPCFFEDVDGAAATVKGDNDRQMIQEYLLPQLENLNMQNLVDALIYKCTDHEISQHLCFISAHLYTLAHVKLGEDIGSNHYLVLTTVQSKLRHQLLSLKPKVDGN